MNRVSFAAFVMAAAVLVGWGVHQVTSDSNERYDLTGDGQVNALDLMLVAQHFGPVVSETWTPTPTNTATATPTPTSSALDTSTPEPTASPTSTGTPLPTSTSVPTATPTPSGTICGAECGTPRDLCDSWVVGFCFDYRDLGDTTFELPYLPVEATTECLDATRASYDPTMMNGTLPFPCWFSKHEHIMSRVESGSFGEALVRYHRPVDIPAVGERHIHMEVDIKGRTRNYFRIMLSPDLTKRDVDDRSGQAYPRSFIQVWVRNGNVEGTICRSGVCEGDSYPWGDAFGTDIWWLPIGQQRYGDNVRVPVDLYLSQTTLRMNINGVWKVGENTGNKVTFAPLGFDKAYLYLSQVSYNPSKDGQDTFADQIHHWDSVAVDGPTLGLNSLTPAGFRDVAFNAYSATSCNVNGVEAVAQTNRTPPEWTWVTWVARLVDDDTPALITCQYSHVAEGSNVPRSIEVVEP